jgi:hypothetical protein
LPLFFSNEHVEVIKQYIISKYTDLQIPKPMMISLLKINFGSDITECFFIDLMKKLINNTDDTGYNKEKHESFTNWFKDNKFFKNYVLMYSTDTFKFTNYLNFSFEKTEMDTTNFTNLKYYDQEEAMKFYNNTLFTHKLTGNKYLIKTTHKNPELFASNDNKDIFLFESGNGFFMLYLQYFLKHT